MMSLLGWCLEARDEGGFAEDVTFLGDFLAIDRELECSLNGVLH
jgi:hypothetical protein